MNLSNERVLVTGADGFIGSHLTELLAGRAGSVRAFVQYNSLNSWGWLDHSSDAVRGGIEVVAGDIRDADAVRAAVDGCTVVMHLAALIAIPHSYTSPRSYVETNVTGTLNVLQAARGSGVARLVHTSTSEVYGSAQRVPIDEGHPLSAQSPYAASKTAADQMAIAFHRSFGTPVAVIRPFNTYGPRQSARAVIPTVITQIAAGAEAVRLGATTPTRDFNFVADTAAAFIAVAESDRAVGEVLNTGTGYEISIADTAALIAEVMGARVRIEQDPARLRPEGSEVDRLCADAGKLRELTGWAPAYEGREGFARGLAETAAWFTAEEHLRHYKAGRYNT